MIRKIKNRYYTYVPGEFLPVYIDGGRVLANKREFHRYKLARAKWRMQNFRREYYRLTHQIG